MANVPKQAEPSSNSASNFIDSFWRNLKQPWQQPFNETQQTNQSPQKNSSNKMMIYLFLAIVIVAIIVFVYYRYFSQPNPVEKFTTENENIGDNNTLNNGNFNNSNFNDNNEQVPQRRLSSLRTISNSKFAGANQQQPLNQAQQQNQEQRQNQQNQQYQTQAANFSKRGRVKSILKTSPFQSPFQSPTIQAKQVQFEENKYYIDNAPSFNDDSNPSANNYDRNDTQIIREHPEVPQNESNSEINQN